MDTIARARRPERSAIEEFANALMPAAKQAKKLGLEVCGA